MTANHDLNRRAFLRYLLALPVTGAALTLTGCGTQTPTPAAATAAPVTPTIAAPTSTLAPATATATTAATATATEPATATATATAAAQAATANLPAVYMTKDISADGLMKIYEALGRKAQGKVAVKISSGEPGGNFYLHPELIGPLVKEVNGTIAECNTAYGGGRADTASHQRVMEEHGFTAIAPVDIMDADGTMTLPISGGIHLKEDVVGSHFSNYDFVVNLAHFKGHAMGGFGGVIKNQSIGIAAPAGKCLIHTAGASSTSPWGGDQDDL